MGVHRRRRSIVRAILTPILVFVAGGLLALGVVAYLWAADGGSGLWPFGNDDAPTVTATVSSAATEATSTPTPTATETSSPTPAPSPSATAEPVQLDASVAVLNAANISGLAALNADKLTAGGFTAVTAGNVSTNLPAVNTVRYSDAQFETTAQQVAALLGISAVELGVTPEGNVSVFLVTDTA